jgi:hypothetical protein
MAKCVRQCFISSSFPPLVSHLAPNVLAVVQICFAKFDAGHQEFAYATLHAQFAPYASRTQSFHLAIDERDIQVSAPSPDLFGVVVVHPPELLGIQTVRILLRDSETTKQQIKATFNRSETPLASALQANDAEIGAPPLAH